MRVLWVIGCALFLSVSARAATNIIYAFSGTGSGSVGAAQFTNAAFTIRVLADSNSVFFVSNPPFSYHANDALSASIEVAGIGTARFTTGKRMFLNTNVEIAGLTLPDNQGDLIDLYSPEFEFYSLQNPLAPMFFPGPTPGFSGEPSTLGLVTLNPSDITFDVSAMYPNLLLSRLGNLVTLRWSTNSPGYKLETATNVVSAWSAVTNIPTISENDFKVNTSLSAGNRFYRLTR